MSIGVVGGIFVSNVVAGPEGPVETAGQPERIDEDGLKASSEPLHPILTWKEGPLKASNLAEFHEALFQAAALESQSEALQTRQQIPQTAQVQSLGHSVNSGSLRDKAWLKKLDKARREQLLSTEGSSTPSAAPLEVPSFEQDIRKENHGLIPVQDWKSQLRREETAVRSKQDLESGNVIGEQVPTIEHNAFIYNKNGNPDAPPVKVINETAVIYVPTSVVQVIPGDQGDTVKVVETPEDKKVNKETSSSRTSFTLIGLASFLALLS